MLRFVSSLLWITSQFFVVASGVPTSLIPDCNWYKPGLPLGVRDFRLPPQKGPKMGVFGGFAPQNS